MGSVPAISALILGIVVPALAGYIEVCNLMVYSEPGHFGQHAGGKKTNVFGLDFVLSSCVALNV